MEYKNQTWTCSHCNKHKFQWDWCQDCIVDVTDLNDIKFVKPGFSITDNNGPGTAPLELSISKCPGCKAVIQISVEHKEIGMYSLHSAEWEKCQQG